MSQSKHIPVLDHLRGLAALAVCYYHFSCGNQAFLRDGDPIKTAGSFGWLGVEAFFVISGFVIPYSLHLRAYRLSQCGAFFARRLKRLEPPYLACILLVLFLNVLSTFLPGFRGQAAEINWPQLLAHLGYLNAVVGYGWLNPVFWTLAIEFQFYLFMAFAFPLLVHTKPMVRSFSVLAIALLGFSGYENSQLLPYWLPLFAIGMVAFQYRSGLISSWSYAISLICIASIGYQAIGWAETLAGLATALTITVMGSRELPRSFQPLAFFGTISYSLYLLHVPIGGRIINLATRLPDSVAYRYPALLVAIVVSTVSAFVFWWLVERPSQHWSKGRPSTKPLSPIQ